MIKVLLEPSSNFFKAPKVHHPPLLGQLLAFYLQTKLPAIAVKKTAMGLRLPLPMGHRKNLLKTFVRTKPLMLKEPNTFYQTNLAL